jgi:hypothetical protein
MRNHTHIPLAILCFLLYGMTAIGQPATVLVPTDGEYLPGTVVLVHKNQVAAEIVPHALIAENCCQGRGIYFEDSEEIQDFRQVYPKKEREKIVKEAFRHAYGLPMDADLKSIRAIQLLARRGQCSRFGMPVAHFGQLTAGLSCQGLIAIRKSLGRERALYYVNKFYHLKDAEWSFRWENKPDRAMRSNVESLLDQDKISRRSWGRNGHLMIRPRNFRPYWAELVAFDKKEVIWQIDQQLSKGNCNCQVVSAPIVAKIQSVKEIPGLALYYPFDYTTQDESHSAYHGETRQTTFIHGHQSNSAGIHIPGEGHFQIPASKSAGLNLLFNGSFSISFWMMKDAPGTTPTDPYPVFHKAEISHLLTPFNGMVLYKDPVNGLFSLEMSDKEDYPRPENKKILRISFQTPKAKLVSQRPEWNHYVLTVDRYQNQVSFYQNGQVLPVYSDNGISVKAIRMDNEVAFSMGKLSPIYPTHPLSIDDLVVFNRVLTGAEVLQLEVVE